MLHNCRSRSATGPVKHRMLTLRIWLPPILNQIHNSLIGHDVNELVRIGRWLFFARQHFPTRLIISAISTRSMQSHRAYQHLTDTILRIYIWIIACKFVLDNSCNNDKLKIKQQSPRFWKKYHHVMVDPYRISIYWIITCVSCVSLGTANILEMYTQSRNIDWPHTTNIDKTFTM